MKILSSARMWDVPWWKENVTDKVTPFLTGKSAREIARVKIKMQKDFDVVLVEGVQSLWYTLLLTLFGKKAAVVMGEMFLPEPNPNDFKWKIKRLIRQFLYRKVDRFVVFSTAEHRLWAEYLRYDESKFTTILFASNILDPARFPDGLFLPEGDYGFAAGRSGRDYKTFFGAVKDISYPFVVVADKKSVQELEVPKNVTLYCDIPWEEYIELLKKSAFTVVPLRDEHRSTGQVVILEGYAFGKPTVSTRCIGTTDYVFEEETGFLVPPYQPVAMREAIEKMLSDDEKRRYYGKNALEICKLRFSPQAYLDQYLKVFEEAIASYRSNQNKYTADG